MVAMQAMHNRDGIKDYQRAVPSSKPRQDRSYPQQSTGNHEYLGFAHSPPVVRQADEQCELISRLPAYIEAAK
jgi:hypothetical protein